MTEPHKDDLGRWRLSIDAKVKSGVYAGIRGIYESYTLKQVKEIINEMKRDKTVLPVDKIMPVTSWLLLYGFIKFEDRLGSKDYTLIKIEIEDVRGT